MTDEIEDEWLEVDSDATRASGKIVSGVFGSISEAFEEAPDDRTWDFEIKITENE